MNQKQITLPELTFQPVTAEHWPKLEELFGVRGACGGCWCMWWRLKRSEFDQQKGEKNKMALKALIENGEVPGLLAYAGDEPAGWCAIARREAYPGLDRSRILKRVDNEAVWSISCLFVAKPFRHKGISTGLLKAAVEYVASAGGKIVEGYPVEPQKAEVPDVFVWTGLASAFRSAGFEEVARRSPTRPIMRYHIKSSSS